MAILIVAIAVINIVVATALPVWSTYMKREREAELVFRGLQYAEAIRVFQQRFGRLPVRLEELAETEPRSIRKLWKDPMTESGEWGLIVASPQRRRGGGANREGGDQAGADQTETGDGGEEVAGDPAATLGPPEDEDGETSRGPIRGVYSTSGEESMRLFFDREQYDQWHFTVDLVRAPPSPHAGAMFLPRLNVEWVGKPFPPGVDPPGVHPLQPGGGKPRAEPPGGEELGGSTGPGDGES